MKKALIVSLLLMLSLFFVSIVLADNTYYARCNIEVLKGDQISRVNWQAAPYTISVDTKLKVTRSVEKATFVKEDDGESYKVDLGVDGNSYLEKFVTGKQINIGKFPKDVQSNINKGIAKVGMTKERVYIASHTVAQKEWH